MRYCQHCGNEVSISAVACMNCGKYLNKENERKKSKVTAGLLLLFLSGFGIGNFYLEQIGRGVAKICLSFMIFCLYILSFSQYFDEYDEYSYCDGYYSYYNCDENIKEPTVYNRYYFIALSISGILGIWSITESILIFKGHTKKTTNQVIIM